METAGFIGNPSILEGCTICRCADVRSRGEIFMILRNKLRGNIACLWGTMER